MFRTVNFMICIPENFKKILINTENYSDQQVLYFCRIIFATSQFQALSTNLENFIIDINIFANEYNLLSEREKYILSKYFGETDNIIYSFKKISCMFTSKISPAAIRQITYRSLDRLGKRIELYLIERNNSNKISIFSLHLSEKTTNCLLQEDITTVEQLNNCTKSDVLEFKNVGKKTLLELLPYLKTDNSILTLHLSTRASNILRSHGITTVEQFKKMSVEEILNLHHIGPKTSSALISKLHEINF